METNIQGKDEFLVQTVIKVLFIGLIAWSTFSTAYGTMSLVVKQDIPQIVVAIIFSLITEIFLLFSYKIWESDQDEKGVIYGGFIKILWLLAIVFTLFASYKGNFKILIGIAQNNFHYVIVAVISLFSTLSQALISYHLLKKKPLLVVVDPEKITRTENVS